MLTNRASDHVDPLAGYSGLSLFPKTFEVLPNHIEPYDPVADLDSIHKHLKSIALRIPSKLVEQAKTIINGSSQLPNSEVLRYLVSKGKHEESKTNMKENPQERRPALNHKRARFSLKPSSSQPALNLDRTLDIKQLKDPEEFFLAYERLENAKEEIQKQMGGVLGDLNQQDQSTTTRHRRPGILGRSVRYKHQYSAKISESSDSVVLSQDTIKSGTLTPSKPNSQQEMDGNDSLQDKELVASITKAENKVNAILEELLSINCEDLEGDGALNLLQERLQIKPIELEKLCLPDFQDIQTVGLKSSKGKFPMRGNTLSDIDNFLKKITPRKLTQEDECSGHHLASPTPPKSPFASLSSLTRRIMRSNSSSDPFSAHNIDPSPPRNSSLYDEHINKQCDLDAVAKQSKVSDDLQSILSKERVAFHETSLTEVPIGDFDHPSKKSPDEIYSRFYGTTDVGSSMNHIGMENDTWGRDKNDVMDDKLISSCGHVDTLASEPSEREEQEGGDSGRQQSDADMVDTSAEHFSGIRSQWDESTTTEIETQAADGLSRMVDTVPEHHENESQEVAGALLNEQGKAKSCVSKQRKEQGKEKSRVSEQHKGKRYSKRQSLAVPEAGTKWEGGLRRSNRIRVRPLEYWKGERLLYGRIHESLATVIGLKYASPAKDSGQPTLKVKSYVSDEYKELVELAGLH